MVLHASIVHLGYDIVPFYILQLFQNEKNIIKIDILTPNALLNTAQEYECIIFLNVLRP